MAGVVLALGGLLLGRRTAAVSQPTFQRLTFQRGTVHSARFGPDAQTVYYSASWDGAESRIFSLRPGIPESSPVPVPPASLLGISPTGELAILLEKLVISSLNPQVEFLQRTIRCLDFLIPPSDKTGR